MRRRWLFPVCLILLVLRVAPSAFADETLDESRRNYALHFFDAAAHVRFAKELHDHGRRLTAVFVLEAAAQRFEETEFLSALRTTFSHDKFDNSPKAEAGLRARLRVSPHNFGVLTRLADVYISRNEWTKAIPLLQRASKLRPDDFSPVAATAKAYELMGEDKKGQTVVSHWTKEHPSSLPAYQMKIYSRLNDDEAAVPRDMIEEALRHYPDDALLHLDLAMVLERTNDLMEAQKEFERAAALGSQVASIQESVAGFFHETKKNPLRTLEFYLNAYFLDPEFYLTQSLEGHTPNVVQEATAVLAARINTDSSKTGTSANPSSLSPLLEMAQLDTAGTTWSSNLIDKILEVMGSDVEENRWKAMRLAAEHLNDISDDRLSTLLESPDPRKRGMAGYLAVLRRHEKALPVMEKWLQDPAELIRYDALSALALYGDATGRKMVEEYLASGKEPNKRLRQAAEKILASTRK